ncbi:MAG: hypothetical protein O9264_07480 [Leptospira sp.]|nr:hypothetical protein [Leptospira sp.]
MKKAIPFQIFVLFFFYFCSTTKTDKVNTITNNQLTPEENTPKWSAYQGNLTWSEAYAKCASIGRRLPTINELTNAYKTDVSGWWSEGENYWSITENKNAKYPGEYFTLSKSVGFVQSVEGVNNRHTRCTGTKVIIPTVIWSANQGKMNWKAAKAKCISMGMHLPTIEELNKAALSGLTKTWGDDDFWSSSKSYENPEDYQTKKGYHSHPSISLNVKCTGS